MNEKMPTRARGPYEIARILVLSTGHITCNDARLLDQDIAPVISFPKARGQGTADYDAFGYWVHVPDDKKDDRFLTTTASIKQAGYGQAFVDLLCLGRRLGCQWLMLDRDGPRRTDLPRFNW